MATTTTNIQTRAREIAFATSFTRDWQALSDILGVSRMVEKPAGTQLVSKYAEISLENGGVEEGAEIPYSEAVVKTKDYEKINVEKYAKAVTIEAISDHGYDDSIVLTDEQFKYELTANILKKFFDFLATGTLKSTENGFQSALAMAQGYVRNRWKKMKKGISEVVGFCNILDAYSYLGAANVYNVENQFGMNYISNFLGYSRLFLCADDEIPQGTIIATPARNMISYYVNPADSDYAKAGLEYTTDGVTNLVGYHAQGDYRHAVSEMYALMGITLMAEYLDGIAVVSFNGEVTNGANLTAITIGDTTLSPEFNPDTTTYTATTTNAKDKVSVKTLFTDATVELKHNNTVIKDGATVTWATGESATNTVTAKVTNDDVTKTYTITVTVS